MPGFLPDPEYISQIISKRPQDVFIIANNNAHSEARILKSKFPSIMIALHANNNAKVVLVSPDTVWVSSSVFGKTKQIEAAIGLHSNEVYDKTLKSLFEKIWAEAREIT